MRNATYWFCLMLLLAYGSMQGQSSFIDLNDVIKNNEKSMKSSSSMVDAEEIQNLIFNVHPTIYIDQNETKIFGKEQPIIAEISFDNIQLLKKDSSFQNILLLKITSPTLVNGEVPGNLLQLFPKLKYIYFLCHSNCNLSVLKKLYPDSLTIPTIYQFATAE